MQSDKEISAYLIRHYPEYATQIFLDYTSTNRTESIEDYSKRRAESIARNMRHHQARIAGVDVGQIGYQPDDRDFVFLADLEASLGEKAYSIVFHILSGWRIREIAKMMGMTAKAVETEIENIRRYVLVNKKGIR